MNKEQLVQHRNDIVAEFSILQEQRNRITEDMLKLQGKSELVDELISKIDPPTDGGGSLEDES